MRRIALLSFLVLMAWAALAEAAAAQSAVPGVAAGLSDFNGDGFADLAVGVPFEDIGGQLDAGGFNVLYGSAGGLITANNQFWSQDSTGILGTAEQGDMFGAVLATGDFDQDGFSDAAIGIPGQDVEEQTDAGSVAVLFGSPGGLSQRDQAWTQNSPQIRGVAEAGDVFGSSLATGDFNGDGFDDLAMGSPGEGVGSVTGAGAVNVLYGGPAGLGRPGQLWTQDSNGVLDQGEANDSFGASLASGDLNGDGVADLAIGVSTEDVGLEADAGAVNVLYGSLSGLNTANNQFWTQDSADVLDSSEAGDAFGTDLTTGDFDANGSDDLAVGAGSEDVGVITAAGGVNVLYGSAAGLTSVGNQFWTQDSVAILDVSETADQFGQRVTTGDVEGDGFDDLLVAAPFEDIGAVGDAGAVNLIFGRAGGLTSADNEFWNQDSTGIQGEAEATDQFGLGVTLADFDGDGFADLTAGVPGEGLGPIPGCGSAATLYGSAAGLSDVGDDFWAQDVPGVQEACEFGDQFGQAVA